MKHITIILLLTGLNNYLFASTSEYLAIDSINASVNDTINKIKKNVTTIPVTKENTPEKKKTDRTIVSSEADWKNIVITYESNDTIGLFEKGKVNVYFEAKKMNSDNEFFEKNAYSTLKKKAFSIKATTILINEKKIFRAYGEMPSIKITATAYGKE